MKVFLFLLLLNVLTGCFITGENSRESSPAVVSPNKDQEQNKQEDFSVFDATSQRWSGGRQESGKGVIYIVKVEIKNDGAFDFKYLWIDKRPFKISTRSDSNVVTEPQQPGDLLLLRADRRINYDISSGQLTEATAQAEPPIDFEGAALIEYTWNGQQRYKTVPAFKQLEAINYP